MKKYGAIAVIIVGVGMALAGARAFAETLSVELLVDPKNPVIDLAAPQEVAIVARPIGNDAVTYRWKLEGVGKLGGGEGDAGRLYLPPQDIEGDVMQTTISVVVTDQDGRNATASVTFTLKRTPTPVPTNAPLKNIDVAFSSAILAESDEKITAEQKANIWEQFLRDYAQDDPATAHDDELRRAAAAKNAQWQQTATPTPKPTAAPSLPKEWKDPVTGMEFVLIPAGEFMMGTNCPDDDPFTEANEFENCERPNEHPAHRVVIKEPFYMGKYEVTQEEWVKVMGKNPSSFKSEKVGMDSRRHPVENISWNDAQEFLKKLNATVETHGRASLQFRLPSEAEWEYAARAGTQTAYSFGDDPSQLNNYAWHSANSGGTTHSVGQKQPNKFGLYDMHGNVWEWVTDTYHKNYKDSPKDDSAWVGGGSFRVLRGGSWYFVPKSVRSANRGNYGPADRYGYIGFRVVAVSR